MSEPIKLPEGVTVEQLIKTETGVYVAVVINKVGNTLTLQGVGVSFDLTDERLAECSVGGSMKFTDAGEVVLGAMPTPAKSTTSQKQGSNVMRQREGGFRM